jgi:hypothetical protein
MIRGRCRTNIDEYKCEEWPSVFVAVPRRGEWIRAKSGKVLTVVMVTHLADAGTRGAENNSPSIEVELQSGVNPSGWRPLPIDGTISSKSKETSFAEAGVTNGAIADRSVDRCKEKAATADSGRTPRCSEASGERRAVDVDSAFPAPVATNAALVATSEVQ